MIADYGIILEMGGFCLIFSHVWANLYRIIHTKIQKLMGKELVTELINPILPFSFVKMHMVEGNTFNNAIKLFSFYRNLGIVFVVLGLFLQHSWFFNNFPKI